MRELPANLRSCQRKAGIDPVGVVLRLQQLVHPELMTVVPTMHTCAPHQEVGLKQGGGSCIGMWWE